MKQLKLKKLVATEVNGILDFNLNFDDKLNFLIGPNGSGKTTAIKLLLGLLTPSYTYLSKIYFKSALVECRSDRNEKIIIIAEKKGIDSMYLELRVNNVIKEKDNVELFGKSSKYDDDELMGNRKFEHLKIVRAIRSLKTPVFLGLDRRIFQQKIFGDSMRDYERRKLLAMKMTQRIDFFPDDSTDMSIVEIQELINDYILEIANKSPQLTEEFKSEILNNSIKYYDDDNYRFVIKALDDKTLSEKQSALEKSLDALAIGNFKQGIDTFFKSFEKLNQKIKEFSKNKLSTQKDIESFSKIISQWTLNQTQIKRIDEIILLSNVYQNKIAELREPINRLNNILHNFFIESKKIIEILPNGEISIIHSNGKKVTPFELSSGEKQILIMITHLIFYEDRTSPGVFIIDEPELSLHLEWQEILVNSLLEASPNTQFILATHSPTIIGDVKNEKYCISIKQ